MTPTMLAAGLARKGVGGVGKFEILQLGVEGGGGQTRPIEHITGNHFENMHPVMRKMAKTS